MISNLRKNAAIDFLSSITFDGKSVAKEGIRSQDNVDNSIDVAVDICRITFKHELLRSTSEGYPRHSSMPMNLTRRISKISESSICRVKLENQRELITAENISDLFNIINEPNLQTTNSTRKIKQTNRFCLFYE